MKKIKGFLFNNWMYITALMLPWIVVIARCLYDGVWLNGNGHIARGDMLQSIIPYAYAMWDKIHSLDSLSYTWQVMDGIDFHMISDIFISPLTLLMFVFPRNMVPDIVQFLMVCKWSLAAFSMTFFFYNTRFNKLTKERKITALFLGTAFALGNGINSFLEYPYYMEVIVLFPFLLLLVEKLAYEASVKNLKWYKKKAFWYYVLLTYCIYACFYLSFQICIFLLFWFFVQVEGSIRDILKRFGVFVFTSFMAGISNFGLLYISYSLYSSRAGIKDYAYYNEFCSKLLIKPEELMAGLFAFQPIHSEFEFFPNIYISITAVMIAILFPVVKMKPGRKIYILTGLIVLTLSFFIGRLNLLWHINNLPNGVYNRFMYLFMFMVLFMALLVINNIERICKDNVIIETMILLICFVFTVIRYKDINALGCAATMIIIVFLIMMLLLYIRDSISRRTIINLVVVCGMTELIAGAFMSFDFHVCPTTFFGDKSIVDKTVSLIDENEINAGERITSMYPFFNIGVVAGMDSDSGFVSAINTNNRDFHSRLGMAQSGNVVFGCRGASPLVNNIFNIRYGVGESEVVFSDAKLVGNVENEMVYRINRLTGSGFMVDATVSDWDSEISDCFEYQNDFVRKALGGTDIFTEVPMEINCFDTFGEEYKADEEYIKDGIYYYLSEIKYGDEKETRQYDIIIKEDMDLYMYYRCPLSFKVYVFIDGEQLHEDETAYLQSTYHIGEVKKDQKVSIVTSPMRDLEVGKMVDCMFRFARFNEDAYEAAYSKMSKSVYNIEEKESGYVKGTINSDKDGIMMTSIPYINGYKVYVDGKQSEIKLIADTMIGVPVKKGEHTVEFMYRTPYIYLKWIMLIAAMLVVIVSFSVGDKIIRKKEVSMEE